MKSFKNYLREEESKTNDIATQTGKQALSVADTASVAGKNLVGKGLGIASKVSGAVDTVQNPIAAATQNVVGKIAKIGSAVAGAALIPFTDITSAAHAGAPHITPEQAEKDRKDNLKVQFDQHATKERKKEDESRAIDPSGLSTPKSNLQTFRGEPFYG